MTGIKNIQYDEAEIMKRRYLKIIITVLHMMMVQTVLADTVVVRGINYDPIHSLEYAKGMGLDNLADMKSAIGKDLDRLAQFRKEHSEFKDIDHLKTFYSRYDSFGKAHGKVEYNIADVVADWNAKQAVEDRVVLALGVYEFHSMKDGCGDQCEAMTQAQVKAAYQSANKYGSSLIDRIIVGSEDMEVDDAIRTRIVNDVLTIKENLHDDKIKVGTAQIGVFVLDMFNSSSSNYQKYQGIREAVDFIGVNVYPFWKTDVNGATLGVAYGDPSNSPVKADFLAYWNMLNPLLDGKEVVVTEEGWPSGGSSYGFSEPDAQNAQDYFHYWYSRWQIFPTSYYFALYDRFPGLGMESHWGIFAADRTNSLLDGDHSKSIDKSLGHAETYLENQIGISGQEPKPRDASIYACLDESGKGECYPIYGYPNFYLGDIHSQATKKIMFDTSGDYYKSILVKYYNDKKEMVNFCYISSATLKTLAAASNANPQTQIVLRNKAYDDSCDLTGG